MRKVNGLSPTPPPEWEGLKIQQQKSPSLLGEGELGGEAEICQPQ